MDFDLELRAAVSRVGLITQLDSCWPDLLREEQLVGAVPQGPPSVPSVQVNDVVGAECPTVPSFVPRTSGSCRLPVCESGDRARAIALWSTIIVAGAASTPVGLLVINAPDDETAKKILLDVFARKATATLRSRAGSLLQYLRWVRVSYVDRITIFPLEEVRLYNYVCFLRENSAPPTKAERFVQSARFACTLLGAETCLVQISSRVTGATVEAVKKRALRKRPPFTVAQVKRLESIACGEPSVAAIFAGYMCALIYARLRFSDLQMCYNEPTVDAYEGKSVIDFGLYGTKTSSRRRATVFRLLPASATGPGLLEDDWLLKWMENRKAMGLIASEDDPMMPSPTPDGTFHAFKLSSSDACVWLRELLCGTASADELVDLGTHSAKATVLSWLTKVGAPPKLQRRAGYHVGKAGRSELEYGHDAAADILRNIEQVLQIIRAGLFDPDLPRLRRWTGCADFNSALAQLDTKAEPAAKRSKRVSALLRSSSSELSSSSSSDDESSGSGKEDDAGQLAASRETCVLNGPAVLDSLHYFRHDARGTIHCAQAVCDDDAVVFLCGRLATSAHSKLDNRPAVLLNPCASCFRGD
ncbi:unnamed protein product [Symbiodinium natans]|uniref:Uncharacterized protein n=1 Tax=Symbiodinium natans TaxID=878477 RepID=A0A812K972_9DINO|nr:unnamed protein product [Symbiodinium natans]